MSNWREHVSQTYLPSSFFTSGPAVDAAPLFARRHRLEHAEQSVFGPSGPGPLPEHSSYLHEHQLHRHAPWSQKRLWPPSAPIVAKGREHSGQRNLPSAVFSRWVVNPALKRAPHEPAQRLGPLGPGALLLVSCYFTRESHAQLPPVQMRRSLVRVICALNAWPQVGHAYVPSSGRAPRRAIAAAAADDSVDRRGGRAGRGSSPLGPAAAARAVLRAVLRAALALAVRLAVVGAAALRLRHVRVAAAAARRARRARARAAPPALRPCRPCPPARRWPKRAMAAGAPAMLRRIRRRRAARCVLRRASSTSTRGGAMCPWGGAPPWSPWDVIRNILRRRDAAARRGGARAGPAPGGATQ